MWQSNLPPAVPWLDAGDDDKGAKKPQRPRPPPPPPPPPRPRPPPLPHGGGTADVVKSPMKQWIDNSPTKKRNVYVPPSSHPSSSSSSPPQAPITLSPPQQQHRPRMPVLSNNNHYANTHSNHHNNSLLRMSMSSSLPSVSTTTTATNGYYNNHHLPTGSSRSTSGSSGGSSSYQRMLPAAASNPYYMQPPTSPQQPQRRPPAIPSPYKANNNSETILGKRGGMCFAIAASITVFLVGTSLLVHHIFSARNNNLESGRGDYNSGYPNGYATHMDPEQYSPKMQGLTRLQQQQQRLEQYKKHDVREEAAASAAIAQPTPPSLLAPQNLQQQQEQHHHFQQQALLQQQRNQHLPKQNNNVLPREEKGGPTMQANPPMLTKKSEEQVQQVGDSTANSKDTQQKQPAGSSADTAGSTADSSGEGNVRVQRKPRTAAEKRRAAALAGVGMSPSRNINNPAATAQQQHDGATQRQQQQTDSTPTVPLVVEEETARGTTSSSVEENYRKMREREARNRASAAAAALQYAAVRDTNSVLNAPQEAVPPVTKDGAAMVTGTSNHTASISSDGSAVSTSGNDVLKSNNLTAIKGDGTEPIREASKGEPTKTTNLTGTNAELVLQNSESVNITAESTDWDKLHNEIISKAIFDSPLAAKVATLPQSTTAEDPRFQQLSSTAATVSKAGNESAVDGTAKPMTKQSNSSVTASKLIDESLNSTVVDGEKSPSKETKDQHTGEMNVTSNVQSTVQAVTGVDGVSTMENTTLNATGASKQHPPPTTNETQNVNLNGLTTATSNVTKVGTTSGSTPKMSPNQKDKPPFLAHKRKSPRNSLHSVALTDLKPSNGISENTTSFSDALLASANNSIVPQDDKSSHQAAVVADSEITSNAAASATKPVVGGGDKTEKSNRPKRMTMNAVAQKQRAL